MRWHLLEVTCLCHTLPAWRINDGWLKFLGSGKRKRIINFLHVPSHPNGLCALNNDSVQFLFMIFIPTSASRGSTLNPHPSQPLTQVDHLWTTTTTLSCSISYNFPPFRVLHSCFSFMAEFSVCDGATWSAHPSSSWVSVGIPSVNALRNLDKAMLIRSVFNWASSSTFTFYAIHKEGNKSNLNSN